MPAKRPTVVTVVGILQIVFGSLGLLGALIGIVMLAGAQDAMNKALPKAPGQPDPIEMQRQMEKDIPGFKEFQWAETGGNLLISSLMLFGGIGLLKMSALGRTLTILYCFLSILANLAKLVYTIVAVFPGVEKTLAALLPPNAQKHAQDVMWMALMLGQIMAVVMAALSIAYVIFVMVVMFKGSVAQAFQRAASGEAGMTPADEMEDGRRYPADDEDEWRPER